MLFDLRATDHACNTRDVVEPAEFVDGRFQPFADLEDVSHIAPQSHDVALMGSHLFDASGRLIQFLLVTHVSDADFSSARGQQFRRSQTNTAGAASDCNNFAFH